MHDRTSIIAGLIARQPGRPDSTATVDGTVGLLRRVCGAAAHTLSASGAGISLMTEGGVRAATATSDPVSDRIEELQFVLGEGPCVDAFASRRPVLVPDLEDTGGHGRWPLYAPAAFQDGLRAVFAFPLQFGGARLGVLDVFRGHVGSLSSAELTDALTFAEVTVSALLDRQELDQRENRDTGGVADVEEVADEYRSELFQAQGMVMVQLGSTLGEAMARIRAHAYAENRRLGDVARDIVARRLRFDVDK